MINISHYTYKLEIKPEIMHVYIHRDDKYIYTVATDSYRLACIAYDITDPVYSQLEGGFYTPSYFTALCKVLNAKKSSINDKVLAVKSFNITKSSHTSWTFPEYDQLIKQYNNDVTSDKVQHGIIGKYNLDYLIDFFDLIKQLKKDQFIDTTSDITSRPHAPMVYNKDQSYILLMAINN